MKSIGLGIMGLAATAMVLYFIDYVPTFMEWVYNWGIPTAWGIMIGLLVVGGVMWYMGMKSEKAASENKS